MTIREQNEKKKEYLNGYRRMTLKINSLAEQMRSISEIAESAKAVNYDDMPHGHKDTDLSDYIVKLENLEEKINAIKKEQYQRRIGIEELIVSMQDGTECDVLRKRYIECKSWETIAKEIRYSVKQAQRIHGKALIHFELDVK